MATQIMISNNGLIFVDDEYPILWSDKGKNWVDSWCPNTIHAVIWNNLPGQNEIQNKDASTGEIQLCLQPVTLLELQLLETYLLGRKQGKIKYERQK